MPQRIIPLLLIDQSQLVITHQFKSPTYIGDPINATHIFSAFCADELIVLDISSRKLGASPNFDLVQAISSQCTMPLAYGGAITSEHDIQRLISSGVEKVIFNAATCDNDLVRSTVTSLGSQSVCCLFDIVTSSGYPELYSYLSQGTLSTSPETLISTFLDIGVGELAFQSVTHDGMRSGLDQTLLLAYSYLQIPTIFCGGASSYTDIYTSLSHFPTIGAIAAGSVFVEYGTSRGILINYPLNL